MNPSIFISHSANDRRIAEAACDRLEGDGWQCWIAPRDIQPGHEWAGSIVKALGKARLMVLIFSTKANASKHVLREVELGTKREIILLPFRVEDVEPTGPMEFFLAGAQWHDAFEGPLEGHLGVLAVAVSKRLGKRHSMAGTIRIDPFPGQPPEISTRQPTLSLRGYCNGELIELQLDLKPKIIGRNSPETKPVDLELPGDPSISRVHARVWAKNGTCWIEDLNSLHGTRVNNRRISKRRRLKLGDTVSIGDTTLKVE